MKWIRKKRTQGGAVPLTNKVILKEMAFVGLPIIIQYMLTSSISLISSIMSGNLGDKAVAALGIGNQIFFIYSLVIFGLFSGAGVLMSQLFGLKDMENIRKTIIVSAVIGVGVGIGFLVLEKTAVDQLSRLFTSDTGVILMVRDYMDAIIASYVMLPIFLAFSAGFRATKRSGIPMLISFISVLINIGLNYALIFGHFGAPKLGIVGVGVATLMARSLELMIILLVASKSDLAIKKIDILTLTPNIGQLVMKASAPVIINELCWGLGMVIYNILYGYIGLQALTAIQMNSVLQNFFMTLVFGASGAAAIIVGNSVGSGDSARAKAVSESILKISLPVSVVTGIGMILSSHLIMPLYSVTPETAQSFLAIAFIAGIMMPVKFYAVLMITGVLRGGGDAVYTMYLELATMWLIGVPIAVVAVYVFKLPVHIAFGLVFIEDAIKCILAYRRYNSGKWITNYTEVLINDDMVQ
jgi:putative MATE family efflux protein